MVYRSSFFINVIKRTAAFLLVVLCMAQIRAQAEPVLSPPSPTLQFLQIGTGPTAGSYFPLGGLLATAISNPPGGRPCEKGGSCGVPGVIATAQTTTGGVANVEALRHGTVDLALTQNDIAAQAFSGTGVYAGRGPMPNLRAVAVVFPLTFHLVVRKDSDIRSFADLKGKRVSLGEEGSGTLMDGLHLLETHHFKKTDMTVRYLKPSTAAVALENGEIDALFYVSAAPVQAIAALMDRKVAKLLPITGPGAEKMITDNPFIHVGTLPAETYTESPDIPTLMVDGVLICTDALSESLAYGITSAIFHPTAQPLYARTALAGLGQNLARAKSVRTVPLHSGSARFFSDAARVE